LTTSSESVIHLDDDLEGHVGIALGFFAPVDVAENVVGLAAIEAVSHRFHDRSLARAVHAANQEDAAAVVAHWENDLGRKLEGLVVLDGQLAEFHCAFSFSAQMPYGESLRSAPS
jgi:hypothetical protein